MKFFDSFFLIIITDSDKEGYKDLISKFPVMKNFAADMYLGLRTFLNEQTNYNILGEIGKGHLDKTDQNVLDSRQSKLQKIISEFKSVK